MKKLVLFIIALAFSCNSPYKQENNISGKSWEEIALEAKNSSVTFMKWQGDPLINAYVNDYVKPKVKELYNIDLKVVSGQGNDIVNLLIAEKEANVAESEIDMMWINGETFYQLNQINALYGPFTDKLSNSKYIDWENPFIGMDFQQPVSGYECPWGNVQLAIIYNTEKIQSPPLTLEELEEWVKANPGKFTLGNDFTGMTLLKSWLIHFAGGNQSLNGDFDEGKYKKFSKELWSFLNRIKPYLWNNGESFPSSIAQLHQLYANGEIWFTMSNNDSEVDNKILEGTFPENSSAYVPNTGTIQNSHYLGIVAHSAKKATAMQVINFMISPEAQLEKMQPKVWGDHTILSIDKLDEKWQAKFKSIPGRHKAPNREEIKDKALMEPAPQYMIRLFDDFRKQVIEN